MTSAKEDLRGNGGHRTPTVEQLTETGRQLNATNADFLRIDVETALTFTNIALTAEDDQKRERNRKNARHAHDTIVRLSPKVSFTPDQEAYMKSRMEQLRENLRQLGEKI